MESFDIKDLPLPSKIPDEEQSLEWTSVIFGKLTKNETLSMSQEAVSPFWLKKNMYNSLVEADIHFPLPVVKPSDFSSLQKKFDKFTSFDKYKKQPGLINQGQEIYQQAFKGANDKEREMGYYQLLMFLSNVPK